MRSTGCLLAAIPLLLGVLQSPLPAVAQADPYAVLDGHWRCAVAGGRPTERSYFTFPAFDPAGGSVTYGRADTTEPDGRPSATFEHIAAGSGRPAAHVEAVEGSGTAGDPRMPLVFAGPATGEPNVQFGLGYAVLGDTLVRTAARGATKLDDERCTREPAAAVDPSCAQPNLNARTLHVDEVTYPAGVTTQGRGLVQILVTLDDRSRVLWTDVLRSENPAFDAESIRAARTATYRTQIRDCRPVAAQYIFSVDFASR